MVGWNAKHLFLFANYHDTKRMYWGGLRVWNGDTIAPQTGLPPHAHKDMEIITYVREGAAIGDIDVLHVVAIEGSEILMVDTA